MKVPERIDLHMHSLHSDGSLSPQELMKKLRELGADLIAVTDHDSVGTYMDILDGEAGIPDGLAMISGVELSCRVGGDLRDMLGYGFDVPRIHAWLLEKYSMDKRIKKQQMVMEKLKEQYGALGLIFDPSITVSEGKKAEAVITMHRELVQYPENLRRFPFIRNITRFFWDYVSNPKTPFYINETFDLPTFAQAAALIHEAGGRAFLAHPYAYRMSDERTEDLVREAKEAGADGLELWHSSNQGDDVAKLRILARKYDLLFSGGSDYHGTLKPEIDPLTGIRENMRVEYEAIRVWADPMPRWTARQI